MRCDGLDVVFSPSSDWPIERDGSNQTHLRESWLTGHVSSLGKPGKAVHFAIRESEGVFKHCVFIDSNPCWYSEVCSFELCGLVGDRVSQCLCGRLPFQELAHLIPDIGSSRVQEVPPYNGSRDTTRIMMATRSKFDQLESPAFASGMYIVLEECALCKCLVSLKTKHSECGYTFTFTHTHTHTCTYIYMHTPTHYNAFYLHME